MRIMAVDFGDARTGLAICDSSETLATPVGNITEKSIKKMAAGVADAVRERGAEMVVVGLPVNMDGTEGPRAAKCRKFASILADFLDEGFPMDFWDERVSTMEAHRYLLEADLHGKKQRAAIDPESARVILDSYLTYRKNMAARAAEEGAEEAEHEEE